MRHLGSIVLSIIFAPLIYVLAGVGEVKLATNAARDAAGQGTNWTDVGIGAGTVVIAGALLALLVMARLSPFGPIIAAVLFIGASVWGVLDQSSLVKTLGHSVFGISGAAEAPLTGVALLLAVPLLATVFSPRRWRAREEATVVVSPTNTSGYIPAGYTEPAAYEPTTLSSPPHQTTPETAADAQPTLEVPVEHPAEHPEESEESKDE